MKVKPTVMIVEDEELLLQAITTKLKLSDIEVVSCMSGKQAIDYMNNFQTLPDAIWLDYYLKDMNGLEFMQELKKHEAWMNIPVLVVSNSANPEKVHMMLTLGARSYLLKAEHRLDDIISTLRKFLAENSNTNKAGNNE